jgi:hypothetical protein
MNILLKNKKATSKYHSFTYYNHRQITAFEDVYGDGITWVKLLYADVKCNE